MMLRAIPLALALHALAACNTPSAEFRGAEPTRIAVNGSVFDVRVRDDRVEAIRVNPEFAPRRTSVLPQTVVAMERVSGCTVDPDSLRGDQAMMTASLDCGRGAPPVPPSASELDCEVVGSYRIDSLDQVVTEWDCRLI